MEHVCDNTSVGVIIQNQEGDILLLHRARFPFGMAPPAGHIDDHGSPEQAAVAEVFEEVGLVVSVDGLRKVISERRINNQCRRTNGDYHMWTVYTAQASTNTTHASESETKGCEWVSPTALQVLANTTKNSESTVTQQKARVLETIWLNFFVELGFILDN